jgi:hypothetical protein
VQFPVFGRISICGKALTVSLSMNNEHAFALSTGYIDDRGGAHRKGIMRFATVRDEMVVSRDSRGQSEPRYQAILVLARVITRLGELEGDQVTVEVIESLPSADLAVLRDLYRQVNEIEPESGGVCPHCGGRLGPR